MRWTSAPRYLGQLIRMGVTGETESERLLLYLDLRFPPNPSSWPRHHNLKGSQAIVGGTLSPCFMLLAHRTLFSLHTPWFTVLFQSSALSRVPHHCNNPHIWRWQPRLKTGCKVDIICKIFRLFKLVILTRNLYICIGAPSLYTLLYFFIVLYCIVLLL